MYYVIKILLYIVIAIVILYDIYVIEYFYTTRIRGQVPLVFSSRKSRKLVAQYIARNYKNAELICEVGSGIGGMKRMVARYVNARVIGLENIRFNVFCSKIFDWLSGGKSETVLCDAYEWLDNTNEKIDVIISYMEPTETTNLIRYSNKINVIISLDFQINGMNPTSVINAGRGFTKFRHKKYPHRLYIYELHKF